MPRKRIEIKESSGNVFEDLGFEKEEATSLLIRSRLMLRLIHTLKATGRTQKQLGVLLGIGQSRVSDLLKGKSELFSLDMIVTLMGKVGLDLSVNVNDRATVKFAGPAMTFSGTSADRGVYHLPPTGSDVGTGALSGRVLLSGSQTQVSESKDRLVIWAGSSRSTVLGRVGVDHNNRAAV